ncbi:calcium-translocating P-type ATPase, SERCA-type [Clostridium botulinum]|uniref:calcium-translocating P-type ATPase, SERCA-type n=1 Tax=Clostridium botulinum TaxID=1491 RepID=UPI00052CC3C0|nr:calcium-translocating P-type ATPase, SERCA-type [Clostridium botulinum]KGM96637.1 ATPase [Clostridium botulinum D str. CCUG 7971]KOC48515.1 ATPase [Clostridium botulinum]MCD3350229.1 calcium-translocating P-type ATPase, SERCA-type [Clostridium botulinum D/C]MCD3359167.1 calcium-translocating P-type ATPase, SERCA-type [Clostridium botulinum D/C]MCD3361751.1 calcium-translocating P-type ATPase, SERCA-type [Clostridium botulinum D/C]
MDNEKFLKKGLTSDEAKKRMKEYGPNVLEKKKRISPVKIFLEQFNDFIIWVLIAATILSAIMGEKADAITIVIIVIMNAILGFIQEYKTEKSLEALQNLAAPTSKVLRDQEVKVISAEELVPGDIVILESGDRVPADSILIEGNSLVVDESLLTGESVGVDKNCDSKNSNVYMGTVVLKGKGRALVENTGMKTEMGKIADMLDNIETEKSPLKKKLASLGKVMVVVCLVICIVVTFMGIMRGQDKYQMFLLGVSLAVAAIPEGMPAIVTVALALGVSRMLKRNALIRKLPAVETLGCTSIICSDKTGTLTQNNMTVEKMYFNDKIYDLHDNKDLNFDILKKTFVYCNDCGYDFNQKDYEKMLLGDPTETALVKALFKKASDLKEFLKKSQRLYDIPFDSTRKMMSVIMDERGKKKCYVKGAPERVIDRCKYILMNNEILEFTDEYRRRVNKKVEEMSYNALRCIAAAYKDKNVVKGKALEEDLIFVGIAGMKDPPRPEAKEAVLKCKMAGIKPVMITGDHKNTAYAIAKELRICKKENEVITGEELDKLSEKELIKKVNHISVFARVSPKHKLSIVRAFKKRNNIVAMTGDGVNDAPAVKEADIGVSMGISGTDVTKEASSMILLDDNFTTIVSAVEEGRIIYDNIRKFIRYLLSCNLGEVLTMFLSSLFYLETPLLPIQILFINLATDGLPAIALGVDPADKDIMIRKPRDKNESVFARGLKEKIILRGSLIGVCTIFAFLSGKYYGMNLKTCRTLALCTLIMSQLIHVFECRSENHSIFEIKLFTNMYLVGAVTVSICMLLSIIYTPFLQEIFHTVPLHLGQWTIIIFFSGFISFINSLYLFFRRR